MKTSKKFIAGISAFLLAISTSITVSAVTTDENDTTGFQVMVSGSQEDLEVGDTFDVTVDLKNIPETGIAGCEFAVSFDSNYVELQSVVENTDLTGDAANAELEISSDLASTMINGDDYSCLDYNVTDGKLAVLWATGLGQDYFIKEDGTLVTLIFQVVNAAEDASLSTDIGIEAIRNDGSVLFASVDESGNYVEQTVDYAGTAGITIGDSTGGITTSNSGTVEPTEVLGDVNFDGQVRNNDVQMIRQHILHLADLEGQALINADVNKDGSVRNNDVQLIRQYVLHIIDSLETASSAE